MFDFAWSELMIIGVVTLVVVGPKDLPFVLRTVGRWIGKARAMAREFRSNVDVMIREAELHDVQRRLTDMSTIDHLVGIENSFDVACYPTSAGVDPDKKPPHERNDRADDTPSTSTPLIGNPSGQLQDGSVQEHRA